MEDPKICVIGLGFVGLPVAATFADLGFQVTGVDAAPYVLECLRNGKAHFEEEGLPELLSRTLGKNLSITGKMEKGEHDIYIIAVGTPIDEETSEPVLEYVESASEAIGNVLKKGDLVIMRSTVPTGVTRKIILPILEKKSGMNCGEDFDIVFAPERLISGKAIQELRELPQIIGGLTGKDDVERASTLFKKLTPKIVVVENLEAAEMGKLIDNTYRDFHFAYANQMACLCEKIGIDAHRLIRDVNRDYKRNRIPLPGPGVGGICLTKDPQLLCAVGREYGYEPVLTKSARMLNEEMPVRVAKRVLKLLQESEKKEKPIVFILGFAFKGNPPTSDTRNSPTSTVVKHLQETGCTILGYDPVVPKTAIEKCDVHATSIEDGFAQSDIVIIMTNHTEFSAMDIEHLAKTMKQPAIIYDGWHLFDTKKLRSVPDLIYVGTGF